MTAVEIALELIRRFEGFYSKPYLCPAGIPTIGYGSTYYKDGTHVALFDPPITQEQALELLVWAVETKYLPGVLKLCPGVDTPGRAAALIDFAYNLGNGRLKSSTLRRRVNEQRWDEVPAEFMKWTKGGGRELKGLVLRRKADAALV